MAFAGVALFECTDVQGAIGAACIKGEECLSGLCSDQVCVAAAPALENEPPLTPEASPPDAGSDAGDAQEPDATSDASADAGEEADASSPEDASDGAPDVHPDHATEDAKPGKDAKSGKG